MSKMGMLAEQQALEKIDEMEREYQRDQLRAGSIKEDKKVKKLRKRLAASNKKVRGLLELIEELRSWIEDTQSQEDEGAQSLLKMINEGTK